MFMSTDLYLKRITQALEKVVAPEIESDRVRGQVFAVINLIEQLAEKIEYKPALIQQEIEMGSETFRRVVQAVEKGVGDVPKDLQAFLQELERPDPGQGLGFRDRVEEMLCQAIDFFYAHRGRLEPAAALEVDGLIRGYITKITTRDLGLLKPPNIEKISRSKRPPKNSR
ncbi:MAG: hypothetical protein A2V67_09040 [Deltaproteobacteria bacterium RBG_13_61_14]|nr:MAG: hypothetical protein A2V67_09040 [Deltaproteobacteria bacterium RBG_13_61_14]